MSSVIQNDTKGLKGANMKARKQNITPAIGELIQIASEKAQYPDYKNKHGAKAQFDGIVIIQDLEYRFMMKMEIWSVITFFNKNACKM